jgi:hypothetical protein
MPMQVAYFCLHVLRVSQQMCYLCTTKEKAVIFGAVIVIRFEIRSVVLK